MDSYRPTHRIRVVTAAALFDGHDASINIMRRLLQRAGAEVIHLGHNRSAQDIARAAIHEDVQAVAISSYQGGHNEFFPYVRQLLDEAGGAHVQIFGGGGGVIVPREIEALEAEGISRIFSPEDGRSMGLEGMIEEILKRSDFDPQTARKAARPPLAPDAAPGVVAQWLSACEADPKAVDALRPPQNPAPVVGIAGPGGAGKSSLTDELLGRFALLYPDRRFAVLAVDPSKRRHGGALLGDRIRINTLKAPNLFMRSFATRDSGSELSSAVARAIRVCRAAGFDLIFVESAGTGQKDDAIAEVADHTLYVMTAEFGAQSQLEKIAMLDTADFVAINKFERRGAEDALRDVKKQLVREQHARHGSTPREDLPVFGTMASRFNDPGVWRLFGAICATLDASGHQRWNAAHPGDAAGHDTALDDIARKNPRYLADIADVCRRYHETSTQAADQARGAQALSQAASKLSTDQDSSELVAQLRQRAEAAWQALPEEARALLGEYDDMSEAYRGDEFRYQVRDREIVVPLTETTLSGSKLPKISTPEIGDWGDRLRWLRRENVPGRFPYTAGVFPLKRQNEQPARMFAGEGPPERTNARFHLLAQGQPAKRLSTAFDSVTLYGEDPHERPDIYGKIGESGVSVATVEDAERLYAGFNLSAPDTSVSMTINGPAPIILAFFFNAAIRQQCRLYLAQEGRLTLASEAEALQPDESRGSTWEETRALLDDDEYQRISAQTLRQVRGTVQADILKEDQAQNTCIFATDFALRMMGDVQSYFIENDVRNYYSVSISGYHIAEAGANPITQLAFTLANGFTYVEYYRARGFDVDAFAPNLSFFFSNGLDAEYAVLGRVARRIWSIAMRDRYDGNERSQKLKYHIQTSGRSLHAMEMDFNDIRTTLQALMAIQDNCNSLHTNAYDEALTTPTDESVRRALAIQLVIQNELGLAHSENLTQGSFFIEKLTDLVERAVLDEFDRLADRGGVLGAMETQYQRGKIQDESLLYEEKKHSGEVKITGVNTFMNPNSDYVAEANAVELRRASKEEKDRCIERLRDFQARNADHLPAALDALRKASQSNGNIFAALMEATPHASLGQLTAALYQLGGEYRRNM